MAGASLTTELLKPLIAQPGVASAFGATHVARASWPSGHATAAMAVGLCAVLVVPRALRLLVAMAATLLAVGVGYSVLVLAWHMPSDVFGGYLVAGIWVSLALAALWWSEERWPSGTRRRGSTALQVGSSVVRGGAPALRRTAAALLPGALIALAAMAALAAYAARGTIAETYAAGHVSFIAAASAIAGLAALLATGLALALRGSDRPS
jgi:hypothetical protein